MSKYSITYSTELMQNYLQAEILAPEAKLQALQTQNGTSLLFSIGTDNALYVTKEVPAARSGWERSDLSSVQIRKDFSSQSGLTCKDFASAQVSSGAQASIHLAMVLADPQNDHLYLSLANSGADTAWTSAPTWTRYPFDDPAHHPSPVKIVGVFISEATDGEYIVVDILRDPSSPEPLIFRYYIDVDQANGYAWHPHDVSVDLEPGKYSSCLGRRAGHYVDGLYTIGRVGNAAQFMYQPLYNVFNPDVPPTPSLFHLPGGAVPDAIAACRHADDTSDLYATAGGTLYYLNSHNQGNDATATALLHSPRFNGVRSLFASAEGDSVMVWGLNANDEIFYTTCALSQLTSGTMAWSVPLPILTGAEQVAPYLDRTNSANTFFAHTGQNQLTKAVKSPVTGLWTFRSITLDPPASTTPAQSFSSYTTRVQVTNTANGQPAPNVPVTITATNVSSVRINYLYYVIGPVPVQVNTDPLGVVTIVEPVETVAGTRLSISVSDAQVTVNPMENAFKKATTLTTSAALANATITYQDGRQKKLVPAGTSQAALQATATGIAQLSQAYASLPPSPALATARAMPDAAAALAAGHPPDPAVTSLTSTDSVLVDVGDLFSWLGQEIEGGIDYAVHLIKDDATKLWNFIVTIAGQSYQSVLNCVETVVAAAQWLYSAIKAGVDDLLKYLQFLFEWDDVTRTKQVMANLTKVYLNHQVDQIENIKDKFDQMIATAERAINGWAGTGDWSGLGTDATATPNSKSTPTAQANAPGALLSHHFQHNGHNISQVTPAPPVTPSDNPIKVLVQALEREADTIGDTISRLQDLAANFTSMPLAELLKELVAIFSELVLESAKNVIDALFDILLDIAKAALAILDTPIHVPILSDVLKDFGVPEFSFLDIACWVAAVPVTLAYKLAEGVAPFPDSPKTHFLISVTDYATLMSAFGKRPTGTLAAAAPSAQERTAAPTAAEPPAAHAAVLNTADAPIAMDAGDARTVHIIGHGFSGFCSIFGGGILSGFEAASETGDNPWSIPSAVIAALGGVSGGVSNALTDFLVPMDPIENPVVSWLSTSTTAVRVLCKIVFSGPVQKGFAASVSFQRLAVSDGRGIGSVVDFLLVIPGGACSIWHFMELSGKPAGASRSIAIIDETSVLTTDIARGSYMWAVNTEGLPKAIATGVMVGANVCTGGLQFAEAMIY